MADAEVRNYLTLRAYGLQRSGNHAILRWIIHQHRSSSTCLLNNVKHGNFDPFQSAMGIEFTGNKRDPRLLVYSYEDCRKQQQIGKTFLDSVFNDSFALNRQSMLGTSLREIDLLIIRDPFNFFASRCKKLVELTGETNLKIIGQNWKELAKRAIKFESVNDPHNLVVRYNTFIGDERYRKKLSATLGGEFSDASLSIVSGAGGGSSFDHEQFSRLTIPIMIANWRKFFQAHRYARIGTYASQLFSKGGQSMAVNDRWKLMRNQQSYRSVFRDRKLLLLSEQLFGEIQGTRQFVSECCRPRNTIYCI